MKQMTAEDKYAKMTEEPVERLIMRLAVPTVISMLVSALYNMADTFFVGLLNNTSATGAVGVVFPLMAVIQAVGFTFGQGSGNAMSRSLGRREAAEAERIASTGLYSALIAGAAFSVGGLLFLDPLMSVLGSTRTILPYASEYGRYILIASPWMMGSLVLNNQLRLQGSAFFSMIGISLGALLNVALDPLFIFTFGMGVTGAALATALSQLVSFVLLFTGATRGGNIRPRLKDFRADREMYKEILRGGLPSLWRQGLNSAATVMLNVTAGAFGDAAIAGMTVVTRVMMFAASMIIGFGQGYQPVCGFNYGAGLYHRVRRGFHFTLRVMFVIMLFISLAGLFFAPRVIELFSRDGAVVRFGVTALRFQCMAFPLMSLMYAGNMMLQNIGKAMRASLLAMSRQGIFFLPAILLLPRLWGMVGLQLVQPVSDLCSFALSIPILLPVLRELKDGPTKTEERPTTGAVASPSPETAK